MRALKWVFGGLAVLVILIVAGFFLIPTDRIAGIASARVEAATGRSLTLKDVSPSLFPLGVSIKGLEISNADWSQNGPMLSADQVAVSVDLGSLFSGTPRVKGIFINAPQILLERDDAGRANWDLGSGETAVEAESDGPAGPSFILDQLEIFDGQLRYVDPGQSIAIEEFNVTTALLGDDVPMGIEGSGRVGGLPLTLETLLDRPGALTKGGATPLNLALHLGESSLTFSGALDVTGEAVLDGALGAEIPHTGDLMVALGMDDPELPDGFGRSVSAKGVLKASSERVDVSDLVISSGPSVFAGKLAAVLTGDTPHLEGNLHSPELDLSSFSGDDGGAGPGEPGAQGWSKDPISLSGLDAVTADLRLSAGTVLYSGSTFVDPALRIKLSGGVLNAALTQMQAYGGSVTGKIAVRGGGTLGLSGGLNATSVSLKNFMGDFFDFRRIEGSGDVTANFAGTGGSMYALMNGLDGDGNINFGQGELLGIDLMGMIQNFDAAFGNSAASTIFNSITATFKIVDGVVTNVDLNFLAPFLEAVGEGTIGLGDQTMNYRVTPKLLTGEAAGLAVPVLITGPWSNLKFRPDLEGLVDFKVKEVEKEIKKKVEQEVKKVEEDVKKKVEDEVLKGLGKLLGGN